ncbi:MAG: aryl-sulfate sulfotransferase [Planctomycetota bacterium JB042]
MILAILTLHAALETDTPSDAPRGLLVRAPAADDGFTVIAPLDSTKVHLVDMDGEVVHTWETGLAPGGATELTPHGTLLRCGREDDTPIFHGGGLGGHVRELAWNGDVLWSYELHGAERQAHHDLELLPNGNLLLIAWEHHSREEAIARGRDEDAVGDEGFWTDVVVEIEPTRPRGGRVVWEWRTWDHLVQDRAPEKPGFGSIPESAGRIDVNGDHRDRPALTDAERERLEKLEAEMEALGYTGGSRKERPTKEERQRAAERKRDPDWLHTNAVAYHPALDLIVLSTPRLNELWVIDHSTTTAEARGSTGGRRGRGGELLWRWGNPRVHGAGTDDDRRLYFQHDPRWLPGDDGGRSDEPRLLVFNNGGGRKVGDHSTVEELVLPFTDASGFEVPPPGVPFGPARPIWTYRDAPEFYSGFISGAERLPNGNTLICEGAEGRVFEVTRAGDVVWDFRHELGGDVNDHGRGGRAPPLALFRAQRVPRTHPGIPSDLVGAADEHGGDETAADPPRGLRLRTPAAFDGYTLFGPLSSTKVHLVDMDGEVVHSWETGRAPGEAHYLLPNGHLLRSAREDDNPVFRGGGIGGHVQEFSWDGELVWHAELHGDQATQHHDLHPLENGNVLLIAWEAKSRAEAIAAGRDEDAVGDEGLWPCHVREIEPTPPNGGKVVWEWHAWDHLVQDRDPSKPNFGAIPDHPGRIDVNGDHRERPPMTDAERERLEKLEAEMEALGYTGGSKKKRLTKEERKRAAERKRRPDWLHLNSVALHPTLDLLALSSPRMNEVWVIDRSTTTEEARGSTGGRWGKGGDLLWRWGNPRLYGAGTDDDRRFFYQHDPTWLTEDVGAPPGELRLLVFNNGGGRPGGDRSTVEEFVLPFDPATGFVRDDGAPFGPDAPSWTYEDGERFYSGFISGAQRLPNGNTLICEGDDGRFFEVTRDGEIVWEYLNPFGGEVKEAGPGGNAPKHAVFRATRIPPDHPGLRGRFGD